MASNKRKSAPPRRLNESEQHQLAWSERDVRPALQPAVEDQLAVILEDYAQQEEAQVDKQVLAEKKKRSSKSPCPPRRRSGTPAIPLCTFAGLARLNESQSLDSTKTLRVKIDDDAFLVTDEPDSVIVAKFPETVCPSYRLLLNCYFKLAQDLQAVRAILTLVNSGFVSLLPQPVDDQRLNVRVFINHEAVDLEASFDDAAERPFNCELRLLMAVAMTLRGDTSFEVFAPRQRARTPTKVALSAEHVQKIWTAVSPPSDAPVCATVPPALLHSLRTYQLQAVEWMCRRESNVASYVHPLWEVLYDISSPPRPFLYNRCIGRVKQMQELPLLRDVAGGILADEMGLGKSLEILALLLARPSPLPPCAPPKFSERVACTCGATTDDHTPMVQCDACLTWFHASCISFAAETQYHCASCTAFVSEPPVPCRATLIICPASILQQWCEEIRKHTAPGSVQVRVYKSVRHADQLVHPRELLQADVVLTTYEALRDDLSHVQDGNRGRPLRNKRRYPPLPTPLTHLRWHRIVLAECQLVEGHTAAAEMASQLTATYRWAVSGTPIGTLLDDLHGLFRFLNVAPYCERVWWMRGIAAPFHAGLETPLLRRLQQLMWRNSKATVADQLNIPRQHEQLCSLRFKEVEAYWYKKQYDDACFKTNELLTLEDRQGRLTTAQRAKLLLPLLQLRQACCHPQVGAHGIRTLRKNPMTMEQLLDALIEKAKIEALDAQRSLLAAINGLAALALCQNDSDKAVEIYRECMMVMSANEGDLQPDKLQRMHCLHNLASALEQQARQKQGINEGGVALQVRRLNEEEEALRQDYVRDRLNRVTTQHIKKEALTVEATNALNSFSLEWVLTALTCVSGEQENLLISLIQETLEHGGRSGVIGKRRLPAFRDLKGLQLILVKEIDELLQARREFMNALAALGATLTQADVAEASNCSRCRRKKGPLCRHCAALPLMEAYRQRLFTVLREAEVEAQAETIEGEAAEENIIRRRPELLIQRTPSEAETALKLIQGFAAHHLKEMMGEKLLGEADASLQAMQLLKKELDAAQALWRHRMDYVAALDEVDMCLTRISLVPDQVRVPENERHYRIHAYEIPAMITKLSSDKLRGANELAHAQRQLQYLRHLTPQMTATAECPVCHEPVGPRRVLFPCGHVFCSDCVVLLMRHSHSLTTVKCPSCREIINKEEVSYVQDDAPAAQPVSQTPVRGSYGTKIEAIVRTLLDINSANPLAKSIVFSEWSEVLRIIANALDENNVPYMEMKSKKEFERAIATFKHSPAVRVLLMTTKQGANGLNLIEATNVLLVEPLLNPAVENQAINRVHRIGQTNETRVYRFVMSNTVEERIFAFNRRRSASASVEVNLKRKTTEAEIGLNNVAELLNLGVSSESQ